jgi:hypothetical protein
VDLHDVLIREVQSDCRFELRTLPTSTFSSLTPGEPSFLFYRSLCAVKVLLAALRSTLTVLAPQMRSTYRFALEKQLRCFDHCSRIIVRAKFVEVLARYSL